MKVKIGKFTTWFGPYQLAEFICFWAKKEKDEYGFPHTADWVHDFGEWLAHGSVMPEDDIHYLNDNRDTTLLYKFLVWIESKKKRKIEIQIDKWDTWNMDGTLSMIILPMLIQLKATKHGSPQVEDKDVPKHLRSTNAPKVDADGWEGDEYTDTNTHYRWDWVMDEMIWAFTQLNDDNNDRQFHSGVTDIYFEKLDDGSGNSEMKRGPNDTSKYDKKGHLKHQKRIARGTTLFGKYYRGLWD